MPLPQWTAERLLPPGRHRSDLADIYERLVFNAPNQNAREILFSALNAYLGAVAKVIPTGRALIGGTFITATTSTPAGVDVVLIPEDWGGLKRSGKSTRDALYGMLTLRGAIIGQPATYLDFIQPVSGLLDGFLCFPGDEEVWETAWSRNNSRGFPEIAW